MRTLMAGQPLTRAADRKADYPRMTVWTVGTILRPGDTSGTSGDKPGDAAGQGSHNQELPSESENGTGGKDSRPQKVTEKPEAENRTMILNIFHSRR